MRKNRLLGLALLLMVVVFLAIVSAYAQIQLLSKSEAYASPEEAMRALIAASYANVQKVEIIHATKALPFVDDLYFCGGPSLGGSPRR